MQHGMRNQTGHGKVARMMMSDQAKIQQATKAAPPELAAHATVMDWPEKDGMPMKQLRAGTNGWTCFPSTPGAAAGEDPMCIDGVFSAWVDAWFAKKAPEGKTVGIGYMLHGDRGASNTDPFAMAPAPDNNWVVSGPHVMVAVPTPALLDAFPADPATGGPWVMWKGTPYAHLMVPVAAMPRPAGGTMSMPPMPMKKK
jgi:hypothetical protein